MNDWCRILGVTPPKLEAVVGHPEANTFAFLVVALLERGEPMTLVDVAARFEEAGIAERSRALLSLQRSRPGRLPVYRDGDLYCLDPHADELDRLALRLGLRPPRGARIAPEVVEPPPLPDTGTPLTPLELDEAWKGASLYGGWSAQRLAVAVLDASGGPLAPAGVVAAVVARTTSHGLHADAVHFNRRGSAIHVLPDGRWAIAADAAQTVKQTRAAVRERVALARRQAAMGVSDPAVVEKRSAALEEERKAHGAELARLSRALLVAFPRARPGAVALLDVGEHEIQTFIGDEIAKLRSRLARYDILGGVQVRELLRALDFDPRERRLAELGPPQKTKRLNKSGRTLKITTALLVQGSCGISKPFGDERKLAEYLANGDLTKVRRRLEADVKSLFALSEINAFRDRRPTTRPSIVLGSRADRQLLPGAALALATPAGFQPSRICPFFENRDPRHSISTHGSWEAEGSQQRGGRLMRKDSIVSGLTFVLLLISSSGRLAAQEGFWSDVRPLGAAINDLPIYGSQTVSPDGLKMVFAVDEPNLGPPNLFLATRASTDDEFGDPQLISNLASPGSEISPSFSSDGGEVYFMRFFSERTGPPADGDILVASWLPEEGTFGPPVPVEGGVNTPAREGWPVISPDGLELFFERHDDVYVARRESRNDPFDEGRVLDELVPDPGGLPASLSGDSRTLFFYRDDEMWDLWMVTRESRDDPFGAPVPLDATLNTAFNFAPTVSLDWPRDGAKIWFTRCVERCRIWEATWNEIPAREVFRIAVLDASRNGDANVFDGPLLGDLRDSLERERFTLDFELLPLASLAPGSLGGDLRPDLVLLHNAFSGAAPMPTPLSVSEALELRRYVEEEGGAALIAVDNYYGWPGTADAVAAANAMLAPFELALAPTQEACTTYTRVPEPSEHPITDGPFGVVDRLLLISSGWLGDLGPWAASLVDHADSGQPVVATIDRDAIAPGSGRVLVVTDLNWMGDADLDPSLSFPKHEAFFSNALAWLAELCPPPLVASREIAQTEVHGSSGYEPGESLEVTIRLEPSSTSDESCAAAASDLVLEERVPEGWSVDEGSITDGGELSPATDTLPPAIRWSIPASQTDTEFAVRYTVTAGFGRDLVRFYGSLVPRTPTRAESIRATVRGDSTILARTESVLRVGALDESRNEDYNFIDGVAFNGLRETLGAHAAELGYDRVDLVPVRELSEDTLADVQVLLLNNRSGSHCPFWFELDTPEQVALRSFVERGGSALIATESAIDTAPSLLGPFGVELTSVVVDRVGDINTIPEPGAHAVTSGPFSEIRRVKTTDASWFVDLGPYATPLVRFVGNNEPLLAVIERGMLSEGSGRVLFSGDLNWLGEGDPRFWFFRQLDHEELFLNIIAWLSDVDRAPMFRRGDANDDAEIDVSDAVFTLNWLFTGGPAPACLAAANANADANIDLSDAVTLLGFLFLGGPSPAEPFAECGAGTLAVDESLGCETVMCR